MIPTNHSRGGEQSKLQCGNCLVAMCALTYLTVAQLTEARLYKLVTEYGTATAEPKVRLTICLTSPVHPSKHIIFQHRFDSDTFAAMADSFFPKQLLTTYQHFFDVRYITGEWCIFSLTTIPDI